MLLSKAKKEKICTQTKYSNGYGPPDLTCPKTCSVGICDTFTIHKGKGYCDSKKEKEIIGVTSAEECWIKCKSKYNYEYAELTEGVCFCQNTCGCMNDGGTVTIVPSAFELPTAC